MGEDEAALVRLWREKRGEVEPEDLSGNLIVQLGVVTEDLSRRFAFKSSKRRGSPGQPQTLAVSLLLLPLSQPHAGASAILIDEHDARSLQRRLYGSERCRVAGVLPRFDVRNRVSVDLSRFGEFPHSPIDRRARHPDLCTCHSHLIVLLSHVTLPQDG
jgi:hypothetical protein